LETPARRAEGKIPDDISYQSKNQLALELIDQVLSGDVPRLPVVADSAYGNDFDFRAGLRERGLQYAVAVEPSIKVWTTDPDLVALAADKPRGRPREYPALKDLPEPKTLAEVAKELPKKAWRNITWRQGTKGPMRSRFAQVKIWAAHGVNDPEFGLATGREPYSRVPLPMADSTSKFPFSITKRSRKPFKPMPPSIFSFGSNPCPSSSNDILTSPSAYSRLIQTDVALACFAALFIPS